MEHKHSWQQFDEHPASQQGTHQQKAMSHASAAGAQIATGEQQHAWGAFQTATLHSPTAQHRLLDGDSDDDAPIPTPRGAAAAAAAAAAAGGGARRPSVAAAGAAAAAHARGASVRVLPAGGSTASAGGARLQVVSQQPQQVQMAVASKQQPQSQHQQQPKDAFAAPPKESPRTRDGAGLLSPAHVSHGSHDDPHEATPARRIQPSKCAVFRRAFYKNCMGTMSETSSWLAAKSPFLSFLDSCLRGSGQVMFTNNPISGALFLVAIFLESRYIGCGALLGLVSSTLTAVIMGLDKGSLQNGLFGYNGILIGAAMTLFHFGGDGDWNAMRQIFGAIVVMSAFGAMATVSFGNLLVVHLKLTPLTFPFQITTWLWLLGAQNYAYFPVNGQVLQPALHAVPKALPEFSSVDYDFTECLAAILRNVSEVFFVSNVTSGFLMLAGIFVCSPFACFSAALGSSISVAVAVALGAPTSTLYMGLWGFNAVLSALALGGFFFVPGVKGTLFASFSAIMSTTVFSGVASFLAPVGMPTLTFPFTFVVWVFGLTAGSIPGVVPVPISSLTVHEDHYYRFKLQQLVQTRFNVISQFTRYLSSSAEDTQRLEKTLLAALMCSYASRGELDAIRQLRALGADLTTENYDRRSPLHIAAAHGETEVVEYLLGEGVPVNPQDRFGETPLNDAVRAGHDGIARLLRANGGVYNVAGREYTVAIELCTLAFTGEYGKLKRMLENGVDPNLSEYDGRTALHLACSVGEIQIAKLLIKHRAHTEVKDRFQHTPLQDAVAHKHGAVVDWLAALTRQAPSQYRAGSAALAAIQQHDAEERKLQRSQSLDPSAAAPAAAPQAAAAASGYNGLSRSPAGAAAAAVAPTYTGLRTSTSHDDALVFIPSNGTTDAATAAAGGGGGAGTNSESQSPPSQAQLPGAVTIPALSQGAVQAAAATQHNSSASNSASGSQSHSHSSPRRVGVLSARRQSFDEKQQQQPAAEGKPQQAQQQSSGDVVVQLTTGARKQLYVAADGKQTRGGELNDAGMMSDDLGSPSAHSFHEESHSLHDDGHHIYALAQGVDQIFAAAGKHESAEVALARKALMPTLLCEAAGGGHVASLQLMLQRGANVNRPDYDLRTPLHLACIEGKLDVVALLLKAAGANLNAVDRWGNTPLWDALTHRHDMVAKEMARMGASLGKSAIEIAVHLCSLASQGRSKDLRRFIQLGRADPNAADYDGRTPLHLAVAKNDLGMVKTLVGLGADPNAVDRWGGTPLLDAKERELVPILESLEAASQKLGTKMSSLMEVRRTLSAQAHVLKDKMQRQSQRATATKAAMQNLLAAARGGDKDKAGSPRASPVKAPAGGAGATTASASGSASRGTPTTDLDRRATDNGGSSSALPAAPMRTLSLPAASASGHGTSNGAAGGSASTLQKTGSGAGRSPQRSTTLMAPSAAASASLPGFVP